MTGAPGPSPWDGRELALGGVDAALLAMADGMRDRVGHDPICRLAVQVAGHVDPDRLGMRLKTSEVWAWLTSLRVGGWPPVWSPEPGAEPRPMGLFFQADRQALECALAEAPGLGDPRLGSALRVDLHHLADGTSALVLTWHHVLMDARGAELLLVAIGEDDLDEVDPETLVGRPPARDEGRWRRLWMARQARNGLFRAGWGSVAFWSGVSKPCAGPTWAWRVLTEEETRQADARARQVGAGLMRSAWHLTAATQEVRRGLEAQGVRARDVLVPVPQDQRRRGADGPILGNHISTIFFRIPWSDLDDEAASVVARGEQLRDAVRVGWPAAYLVLLDMVRGLPGWLMRGLIGLPSRGRVATFGFSDVGTTLRGRRELRGWPILDVAHYPANLAPPGVTIILSRHADRLSVCVAALEDRLAPASAASLADGVVAALLGSPREA